MTGTSTTTDASTRQVPTLITPTRITLRSRTGAAVVVVPDREHAVRLRLQFTGMVGTPVVSSALAAG